MERNGTESVVAYDWECWPCLPGAAFSLEEQYNIARVVSLYSAYRLSVPLGLAHLGIVRMSCRHNQLASSLPHFRRKSIPSHLCCISHRTIMRPIGPAKKCQMGLLCKPAIPTHPQPYAQQARRATTRITTMARQRTEISGQDASPSLLLASLAISLSLLNTVEAAVDTKAAVGMASDNVKSMSPQYKGYLIGLIVLAVFLCCVPCLTCWIGYCLGKSRQKKKMEKLAQEAKAAEEARRAAEVKQVYPDDAMWQY